ncbi:hypothetical protein KOR42_00470 [Thalassoglobus neptunius]|uniref:Uncharacterized protein n=1 Tax=Thalassoglobus neptunius TaxID=1938619 RepID=A0A5C5X3C1_9PLAN|nr:hypothetical protein KOR42_00470 [Thalassoglobus neptunius]
MRSGWTIFMVSLHSLNWFLPMNARCLCESLQTQNEEALECQKTHIRLA